MLTMIQIRVKKEDRGSSKIWMSDETGEGVPDWLTVQPTIGVLVPCLSLKVAS